MIRQPIVCVLGHVDHGKTTLLDKIRQTAVTAKEAGGITQAIGATEIPIDVIKKICGPLLEKLKIDVTIPGLLFIDTPGHEAFTSLRKRGGSCADLAILVIDINEGFKAQTDESLDFLKEFKTPFLVVANKIDRISGWIQNKDKSFFESFSKQPEWVRERLDELLYKVVGQLSERGFDSERIDRVSDFKKNVAIVPCSGMTGEGIPEVLMILTGLAQQFLQKKLETTKGVGRGSVLEVKELKGHGATIDVVLYDGEIRKGDWLVIGGKKPVVTKIRSLLKPPAMKELRIQKQFETIGCVHAAAGIKISAPGLDKAIAGSPIAAVRNEGDVEKIKEELQKSVEEVEFEVSGEGVILKADTLGSLEALIHILKKKNIPIKKAEVGNVLRKDILSLEAVKDPLKKTIIAFNVSIDEIARKEAKDRGLKIIESPIIYKLIEDYEEFVSEQIKKMREEKLSSITRPAIIKLLPGMTFHVSNPAIVGVEVVEGTIKSGYSLKRGEKEIGKIKAIQAEGSSVVEAKKGEKVAVSIDGPTVGRHIRENDELTTVLSKVDMKILQELDLRDEIKLANKIMGLEQTETQ